MSLLKSPKLPSFFLLLLCLFGACAGSSAEAAVFRDRAAFEAASQNLHTIDFESVPASYRFDFTIDGVYFTNIAGPPDVTDWPGMSSKVLRGHRVGELTETTLYLPPGTTAVGCDQFSSPMVVVTSAGESVTMSQSDGSTFVGFVSDKPIRTLRLFLDFPEPTPDVLLDNLSYGQRRAAGDPPLLLADEQTGRAAAFDSVAATSEPFDVTTPTTRSLATDGRTRVTLFLAGVKFDSPTDASLVSARAVDAQQRAFDLPVEAVGAAKNLSWMSQVTVRLPPELAGAGELSVTVTVRGVESNKATLRVN